MVGTGWVEVSSTRSSGGQDAGAFVEAGRGRGPGRGRGRGRYDQDVSGGRGPADRFAGRGPGDRPHHSVAFHLALRHYKHTCFCRAE